MTLSTQPYKGARDFYPEDKRLQKYLFGVMRSVVERFGYEEYDAPILEPLDLYRAKTGEEIVNEQTYSFEDRGGRQVTIRPEMTPSVSRMVAAKRQELAYPLRWYSIPNLWRYERPQRGRLREHWQLNVDIFGIEGLEADMEIIQVSSAILRAYGATPEMYTISLNSRKLMDVIMNDYLGLSEVQAQTLSKLIDRMHKIDHAAFITEAETIFTPNQHEQGSISRLMELLKVQKLAELPETVRSQAPVHELEQLMSLLAKAGISNVVFDITVMRGFDYYTDIVFEVSDNAPENNRSMFGGGRYDGLISFFGVDSVPTVGFGMGDVTLQNFLETHNLLPMLKLETDAYVILVGDVYEAAQKVINDLREMGLNIAVDLTGRKPDKQTKTADKKGAPYAIFIGEKELADEQFTLKNLQTGQSDTHSVQRIVSTIKDYRNA